MGKDVERLAARVGALIEQGLDVAEAYATAKGPGTRATRDYARALERHSAAVRRHHDRIRRQRTGAVTLTAISGATAVLGVIDVAGADAAVPGPPWWWLIGSALAAVMAVRSRHRADTAVAPDPPALSAAAVGPGDLRRDAIGWAQAQQLYAVRRQIIGMIPAVTALHPDAGRELAGADEEAAPAMAAQVTRLAVLDQVRRDLPGSAAAGSAERAAGLVRDRLAEGVEVYDRLLAAASTMLASPDLGRSSADVLGPAADALTAYAVGLRAASDV